jgi:putative membrane protein
MKRRIFVVCVDRDNDIGRKIRVKGPIIGREKNLEVAQKLILTDPTESDANTMFAGIKKLEEAKKSFNNVEIVTLTGAGKTGLGADKEINRQLDMLEKNFNIEGWIVVNDGAEDAQVNPLLQSRAKIISIEQVIIKQAQAVESTFYTIKEAIKDPGLARLLLGIPGVLLLAYVALGQYSLQAIAFILGLYLLLKGFGIEDKIIGAFKVITESVKEQRISVVMYLAGFISPLFGIWLAYLQIISSEFLDVTVDIISALRLIYPFLALMGILFLIGKAIDSVYMKKSFKIGKYILQVVSIVAIWAIIDAGTLVFLRQADLAWFPANIMTALVALIITMKISQVFDIRNRVTKAMNGLRVIDVEGNYVGRIKDVNKRKQTIIFGEGKKEQEKKRNQFKLVNGEINIIS